MIQQSLIVEHRLTVAAGHRLSGSSRLCRQFQRSIVDTVSGFSSWIIPSPVRIDTGTMALAKAGPATHVRQQGTGAARPRR